MLLHFGEPVDRFIWLQELPENIQEPISDLLVILLAFALWLVLIKSDCFLRILGGIGTIWALILALLLKLPL